MTENHKRILLAWPVDKSNTAGHGVGLLDALVALIDRGYGVDVIALHDPLEPLQSRGVRHLWVIGSEEEEDFAQRLLLSEYSAVLYLVGCTQSLPNGNDKGNGEDLNYEDFLMRLVDHVASTDGRIPLVAIADKCTKICLHYDNSLYALVVADLAIGMDEDVGKSLRRVVPGTLSYALPRKNTSIKEYSRKEKEVYDWNQVVDMLEKIVDSKDVNVNIVVQGDAVMEGESMAAQNWHIAHTLSQVDGYHVTVMGQMEPGITDVDQVNQPEKLLLGYQADLVIKQQWPPSLDAVGHHCGPGCRIVQILPWEFGVLPQLWILPLQKNVDRLWAPSEYNRQIYERSGYDPSRTDVASAGVDCRTLTQATPPPDISSEDNVVTFLFSGGFIPRKGIDIILEEWKTLFCDHQNTRLVLHTNYELGYDDVEMDRFQLIVQKCGNIEWMRKQMLSKEDHQSLLLSADVYLAPFRSEGFGLPIVETLVMGLSVVVSVGGTAADDWLHQATQLIEDNLWEEEPKIYPVHAEFAVCDHAPCVGNQLCVFSPCQPVNDRTKEWRCACETLTDRPSWFEVNRDDLRNQMTRAHHDVLQRRKRRQQGPPDADANKESIQQRINVMNKMPFCWHNLEADYVAKITKVLQSVRQREIQRFQYDNLVMRESYANITNCTLSLIIGGAIVVLAAFLYRKGLFPRIVRSATQLNRRRQERLKNK